MTYHIGLISEEDRKKYNLNQYPDYLQRGIFGRWVYNEDRSIFLNEIGHLSMDVGEGRLSPIMAYLFVWHGIPMYLKAISTFSRQDGRIKQQQHIKIKWPESLRDQKTEVLKDLAEVFQVYGFKGLKKYRDITDTTILLVDEFPEELKNKEV